jgi:hypothetical protein
MYVATLPRGDSRLRPAGFTRRPNQVVFGAETVLTLTQRDFVIILRTNGNWDTYTYGATVRPDDISLIKDICFGRCSGEFYVVVERLRGLVKVESLGVDPSLVSGNSGCFDIPRSRLQSGDCALNCLDTGEITNTDGWEV